MDQVPSFLVFARQGLVVACLATAWLLAATVIAALAIRRLRLGWLDRQVLPPHTPHVDGNRISCRSRIAAVERWGTTLTVGLVAYTAVLIVCLLYQIVEEVVRKIAEMLGLL